MDSNQTPPARLKIVAGLFMLTGIFSALDVIVSLMHGSIDLNLGVLGVCIGPGLLCFSRGWRTCALVCLWITLIGAPVAALVFLVCHRPIDFSVLGQTVGTSSKEMAVAACALVFVLALWQVRVLTRRDIRALFGVGIDAPPPAT